MKRPCLKDFARYSSLNVMGMVGMSCYILADTFFIAAAFGANGITALNLVLPLYSIINGSALMLGMGGAIRYAIHISKGDKARANRVFTTTTILSVIVAAVFFLIGVFLSGTVAHLLGANEEIYDMTRTYLRGVLLIAPIMVLNHLTLCFVRNDGAPHLAMAAMLVSSLSNIVFDYIFIFPLNMGLFGAVLATGVATALSLITLSIFFIKKKNQFRLTKCAPSRPRVQRILSCGLPSFITELSSGIVIIVFNIIILDLRGNAGVAAYGIIANISLVVIAVYNGIAQGIQPLISRNHGAGKHDNVREILRYALITLVAVSVLIYVAIFFGASGITNMFNSEQNPSLQDMTIVGLRIYFVSCIFVGLNIILSVYFASTENPRPAHVISILRGFALVIPMAILLSYTMGLTGVWLTFPITEIIIAIIATILLITLKPKPKPPEQQKEPIEDSI